MVVEAEVVVILYTEHDKFPAFLGFKESSSLNTSSSGKLLKVLCDSQLLCDLLVNSFGSQSSPQGWEMDWRAT